MSDKFESLCEFLRNVPLTQITNSSILYQLLLRKVEDEDVTDDHKEHLRLLQDNNQAID
ncbi:1147_t:CDS:2 [Ambispora gerdemannii]|uniref:1147_t:CDS:1 n=1 Tax=Ambispora gerdemannii TaxID=144530 RepID=A0A9N9CF15_9GLOM|nr:1147_t:CDS:2 [Ambispora gerdemannii]